MGAPKTTPNDGNVDQFFDAIASEAQRDEARQLHELFERVVGAPGVMWGGAIVGYGTTTITYSDGRTADWLAVGFAPRSGKFAIYGLLDGDGATSALEALGRHTIGKGCLYVPRLVGIDLTVLEGMVRRAIG